MFKEALEVLTYLIIILFLALMFTGCTRYQGTSTKMLDDLGVKYEITKTIPLYPNADAVYVENEDKIYVKRGKQSTYLILHELVHKIRSNEKVFLGWDEDNRKIEEAVAVKAALRICKVAGISSGVSRYEVPGLISRTWKVNGLPRTKLTPEQNAIVDREVEVTVELFIEVLKDKGHSIKEIDWVRTIILILI
jgi:hypothetical protein